MAEDTGPLDNSAGAQPLFQQEDGTAIAFYIRPGATKVKVAPLIHRHGGHLCSTQVPGAVLLAWPGEVPAGAPGEYISAQYVTDCVMGKKKLPLEHYRLAPAPTVRSSAEGRMHFTEDEDRAILRYVQSKDQAQATSAGNVLWKEMAQAQVTQHSWQAMRDRYLKQLRGKEEMYLLPPSTKRRALDPDPGSGVRGKLVSQALRKAPGLPTVAFCALQGVCQTHSVWPISLPSGLWLFPQTLLHRRENFAKRAFKGNLSRQKHPFSAVLVQF